ncbi:MAG TPA: SRPBCC family protein [Thermoanaerobaculia bacterium]|jgi:ligand-binding SRPBCC domain-containing protein
MQTIRIETFIAAPPERCFDAARDLDLHVKSMSHTGERAVAGRTSGLIELGEEVRWRARHFFVTQRFTSKITAFDRPRHFQDAMQRGAFRSFVHDHTFDARGGGTLMTDVLAFAAPLGLLGRIAEGIVLRRYLTRLLAARAKVIKDAAESSCDTCRTHGENHECDHC